MRGCNVAMSVGSGSRLPAFVEALEHANRMSVQTILKNIVERAADPRDFLSDPDRLQAVVDYLNARLSYDGLQIVARRIGGPAQRAGQFVWCGSSATAQVFPSGTAIFPYQNR